jgi:hypothetical protein
MGAWGCRAFDNDTANDWAYDLEDSNDWSLVESTFDQLEEIGEGYLDADIACNALGACEVIARMLCRPGYSNAYTEKVDQWVAAHRLNVSPALVKRATDAIERILADESELRDLCQIRQLAQVC